MGKGGSGNSSVKINYIFQEDQLTGYHPVEVNGDNGRQFSLYKFYISDDDIVVEGVVQLCEYLKYSQAVDPSILVFVRYLSSY